LSRRALYHDLIAEQANLGVALDVDGFVFAQFGFGGDEQRSVIYVRAGGVAGKEDEIGVAIALGVSPAALTWSCGSLRCTKRHLTARPRHESTL